MHKLEREWYKQQVGRPSFEWPDGQTWVFAIGMLVVGTMFLYLTLESLPL